MVTGRVRNGYEYVWHNYRKTAVIPVIIVLLAIGVLGMGIVQTGEALPKGIDFTGGSAIQVQIDAGVPLEDVQAAFTDEDVTVRTMTGEGDLKWIVIETGTAYEQSQVGAVEAEIAQQLRDAGIEPRSEVSVRVLGAAVGEAFFRDAQMWSLIAVLIMSGVIFIAFRSIVPSLAVIFAALSDILVAMAGMALFNIELTLGSLAALLLLLGYSVDTDILLSTRVLKQRKESLKDRMWSSIITGSTMTFAAIAAFSMLFLVSTSPVLKQLAAVIIIGLAADLPITWLGNTAILRWYVER